MNGVARLAALALLTLPWVGCGPAHGTIGAILAQQPDGHLVVREVPEGLAADKAGLQPGDEVLLVDGIDVRMLDAEALHKKLSGEVDTTVKLTVVRGEQVLHLELKRTPAKRPLRPRPR